MKKMVGKAKVEVTVEGCVDCGTTGSSGWRIFRELSVRIGKSEGIVTIHICADCSDVRSKKSPDEQLRIL